MHFRSARHSFFLVIARVPDHQPRAGRSRGTDRRRARQLRAVVPGRLITLTPVAGGVAREAKATDAGTYQVTGLVSGEWLVEIAADRIPDRRPDGAGSKSASARSSTSPFPSAASASV